jgi:hypothetical protein
VDQNVINQAANTPRVDNTSVAPYEQQAALEHLIATVPELRAAALGRPQQRLLAIALAVTRAPGWARTSQLAVALQAWERVLTIGDLPSVAAHVTADAETPSTPTLRDVNERATSATPPGRIPPAYSIAPLPRDSRTAPKVLRNSARTPVHALDNIATIDPLFAGAAADGTGEHATHITPPPHDARLSAPEHSFVPTPELREAGLTPQTSRIEEPRTQDALCVRTEFGGIFYLLNAALALELYGDFAAPRAKGITLLPWDWLAIVGRDWFGAEFVRDPVWTLLSALAGRTDHDTPGRDFVAPRTWVIPQNWLAPWNDTNVLHVYATRTRLRVMHRAGFTVFDVARNPAQPPLLQARKLCAEYSELHHATLARVYAAATRVRSRSHNARWLRCLLEYLRARLALALSADEKTDVPALVCRHRADVTITASAVDVHLSLADLPLQIRIAGLDRDAGWIPAAGRSLSFHFL